MNTPVPVKRKQNITNFFKAAPIPKTTMSNHLNTENEKSGASLSVKGPNSSGKAVNPNCKTQLLDQVTHNYLIPTIFDIDPLDILTKDVLACSDFTIPLH